LFPAALPEASTDRVFNLPAYPIASKDQNRHQGATSQRPLQSARLGLMCQL
jgi:hypothetical protein